MTNISSEARDVLLRAIAGDKFYAEFYIVCGGEFSRRDVVPKEWPGVTICRTCLGAIERGDVQLRMEANAAQCLNERERLVLQCLEDGLEQSEYMIHGAGKATFVSLDKRNYITRQYRSLRFDGRNYYATITDRGRELVAALEADA